MKDKIAVNMIVEKKPPITLEDLSNCTVEQMKDWLAESSPNEPMELHLSKDVTLVMWEYIPQQRSAGTAFRGYMMYRRRRDGK